MGEAHRAALKYGIKERVFWTLTPYRLNAWLQELATQRIEQALHTGWFSERFAREERLQGPQHYARQFLRPDEAEQDAEALADAEFARISRQFGIEVVDLGEV